MWFYYETKTKEQTIFKQNPSPSPHPVPQDKHHVATCLCLFKSFYFLQLFSQTRRRVVQTRDDPQSCPGITGENDRHTGWKLWRKMVRRWWKLQDFMKPYNVSVSVLLTGYFLFIYLFFTQTRPLWLSPAQVTVIPVGGSSESYSRQVSQLEICQQSVLCVSLPNMINLLILDTLYR